MKWEVAASHWCFRARWHFNDQSATRFRKKLEERNELAPLELRDCSPQRTWLRGSFRGGGYIGLIDKEEIEAAVLVSSLFACEMCNRSEER
ncbi:MAG: hypothetical protein ACTS43_02435 [Candidatus Hodgkinia cicadicola]